MKSVASKHKVVYVVGTENGTDIIQEGAAETQRHTQDLLDQGYTARRYAFPCWESAERYGDILDLRAKGHSNQDIMKEMNW